MCQNNNCGCSGKKPSYDLCNPCPPEPCTCPVADLSTNCIVLAEDLTCSGVPAGINFTEALHQIDEFICDAVSQLGGSTDLVNVGTGAKIYKGIDGSGKREIRSITSTNSSVTITENTNTINLSVNQNNYVRQLLINQNDLPEDYTTQDIADYILTLPENERTIAETDSKWNVIIYEATS